MTGPVSGADQPCPASEPASDLAPRSNAPSPVAQPGVGAYTAQESRSAGVAPAQSGDVLDDLWRGATAPTSTGGEADDCCSICREIGGPHGVPASAPPVGQDTGQLRDEIAAAVGHRAMIGVDQRVVLCTCGWRNEDDANLSRPLAAWSLHVADALIEGPLRRLIAERDQARTQVQQVRDAIDRHADNLSPTQRAAFARALDGA